MACQKAEEPPCPANVLLGGPQEDSCQWPGLLSTATTWDLSYTHGVLAHDLGQVIPSFKPPLLH